MSNVVQKIKELETVAMLSKHEQIVQGIINAIDESVIGSGGMLPSVNNMVHELGYASKTITKAYSELKERGLVESRNRLGYFIINEDTEQSLKVALYLYGFLDFQESFYNAFRAGLGANVQLDVFFHHNNIEVLDTMLSTAKGQYGMYVIAPIPHPKTQTLLNKISPEKLLLVDRYEALGDAYSHVTQEFKKSTYDTLEVLCEQIKAFEGMTLFYRPYSDYPKEIYEAFLAFSKKYKINTTVEQSYVQGAVTKGQVYFTIGDHDLWAICKDCINQGLEIGKDVGILSHNDSLVKEFTCGGITTYSTDFEKMAMEAASFVLNRKQKRLTVPTILMRRNSL